MTVLSISDAARVADVSRQTLYDKINSGVLSRTKEGIDTSELARVFPDLKSLEDLHIKEVKKQEKTAGEGDAKSSDVELLQRELEWHKELIEQSNRQLREQREMISDQARRLEEKDHFWAKQVEQVQVLLSAPDDEPEPKRGFLRRIFG